ncbi:hypothetical protein MMPV_007495 [Pyropia vietnamensis]
MFYSLRVLTRAGPLAQVWVAGTLGESRLPRRWVASASIVRLAGAVREPDAPLALRLSATLLWGLARVYTRKVGMLVAESASVLSGLQRLVASGKAADEPLPTGGGGRKGTAATAAAAAATTVGGGDDPFALSADDAGGVPVGGGGAARRKRLRAAIDLDAPAGGSAADPLGKRVRLALSLSDAAGGGGDDAVAAALVASALEGDFPLVGGALAAGRRGAESAGGAGHGGVEGAGATHPPLPPDMELSAMVSTPFAAREADITLPASSDGSGSGGNGERWAGSGGGSWSDHGGGSAGGSGLLLGPATGAGAAALPPLTAFGSGLAAARAAVRGRSRGGSRSRGDGSANGHVSSERGRLPMIVVPEEEEEEEEGASLRRGISGSDGGDTGAAATVSAVAAPGATASRADGLSSTGAASAAGAEDPAWRTGPTPVATTSGLEPIVVGVREVASEMVATQAAAVSAATTTPAYGTVSGRRGRTATALLDTEPYRPVAAIRASLIDASAIVRPMTSDGGGVAARGGAAAVASGSRVPAAELLRGLPALAGGGVAGCALATAVEELWGGRSGGGAIEGGSDDDADAQDAALLAGDGGERARGVTPALSASLGMPTPPSMAGGSSSLVNSEGGPSGVLLSVSLPSPPQAIRPVADAAAEAVGPEGAPPVSDDTGQQPPPPSGVPDAGSGDGGEPTLPALPVPLGPPPASRPPPVEVERERRVSPSPPPVHAAAPGSTPGGITPVHVARRLAFGGPVDPVDADAARSVASGLTHASGTAPPSLPPAVPISGISRRDSADAFGDESVGSTQPPPPSLPALVLDRDAVGSASGGAGGSVAPDAAARAQVLQLLIEAGRAVGVLGHPPRSRRGRAVGGGSGDDTRVQKSGVTAIMGEEEREEGEKEEEEEGRGTEDEGETGGPGSAGSDAGAGAPPPPLTGFLTFVRGASRRTAARTFFHTLALATEGIVALRQEQAFGEVWVHARAPLVAVAAAAEEGDGS